MLATLCKIDKAFLKAFVKLVLNDLACIYLVDTMIRDGYATVYKFGRSGNISNTSTSSRGYTQGLCFIPSAIVRFGAHNMLLVFNVIRCSILYTLWLHHNDCMMNGAVFDARSVVHRATAYVQLHFSQLCAPRKLDSGLFASCGASSRRLHRRRLCLPRRLLSPLALASVV